MSELLPEALPIVSIEISIPKVRGTKGATYGLRFISKWPVVEEAQRSFIKVFSHTLMLFVSVKTLPPDNIGWFGMNSSSIFPDGDEFFLWVQKLSHKDLKPFEAYHFGFSCTIPRVIILLAHR